MTAISGRNLLDLYESSGLVGCLARTLLGTSRWASTTCLLTWKDWATPGKRLLFRLWPWTPGTDENDSGLLPTPSATSYGSNQSPSDGAAVRLSLETMARKGLWPTPRANDAEKRGNVAPAPDPRNGLVAAVRLFPTPDSSDRGARKDPKNGHQINLVDIVGSRKLNPAFVEWLMGYPIGWTDCDHLETQSFRKSRKKSSAP
jgi:hypothetical protein